MSRSQWIAEYKRLLELRTGMKPGNGPKTLAEIETYRRCGCPADAVAAYLRNQARLVLDSGHVRNLGKCPCGCGLLIPKVR